MPLNGTGTNSEVASKSKVTSKKQNILMVRRQERVGEALQKKLRDYLGNFPNMGGRGSSQLPKPLLF